MVLLLSAAGQAERQMLYDPFHAESQKKKPKKLLEQEVHFVFARRGAEGYWRKGSAGAGVRRAELWAAQEVWAGTES